MPFIERFFECSECGEVLNKDEETGSLLPCDSCGSTKSRPINEIKETFKLKIKKSGATGKPDLEIKIADDLFKEKMEWRQLKMSIDRVNDCYEKTVIDPETDNIIKHVEEPLSHHKGHGSAKNKSKGSGKKR